MKQIYLSSVPSDFVHNVVQVAEVYQMKMVKAEKAVKNDVVIISPLGQTANIDRMTLVNNFMTLKGKPIKLISLKYDKKYTIMRTKKTSCLAVEIPKSDKVEFIDAAGNVVKGGYVLTIPAANVEVAGETVDFSEANKVPKPLFKKIYQITKLSDAFMERLNIAKEARDAAAKAEQERLDAEAAEKKDKAKRTAAKAKEEQETEEVFTDKSDALPVVGRTPANVYEHNEVTAVIVDDNEKVVGYRVMQKNGQLVDLETNKVAKLARNGEIANVKFVHADADSGRAAYLAGVGISLKELPRIPVGY